MCVKEARDVLYLTTPHEVVLPMMVPAERESFIMQRRTTT